MAVLTRDKGEYEVAPGRDGRRLLGFLRQEVKARVVVRGGPGGRKFASVGSRVLREAPGELGDEAAAAPAEVCGEISQRELSGSDWGE